MMRNLRKARSGVSASVLSARFRLARLNELSTAAIDRRRSLGKFTELWQEKVLFVLRRKS